MSPTSRATSPTPAASTERGQSELVGVVFLMGFVVISAVGIALVGGSALDHLQGQSQDETASQSLQHIKGELASLKPGDVQAVTMGESVAAETRTDPTAGRMTITVDGRETSFVLGSIIYEREGTQIAYQGGGVWRHTDGRTQMVSSPDIAIETAEGDISSIHFDVKRLQGTGQAATDLQMRSAGHNLTAEEMFPHRLPRGPMTLEIESVYYEGWADYFAAQDGITYADEGEGHIGTVRVDEAAQTMILEVDIDEAIPEIHSARIGSDDAGSQPIHFANGTLVTSYDSELAPSDGSTPTDFTDSATIAAWTGTANSISMEVELRGDLYNTLGQHSSGEGDTLDFNDAAVVTGEVHSDYRIDLGGAKVGTVYVNHTGSQANHASLTMDGGTINGDLHAHGEPSSDNTVVEIQGSSQVNGDVRVAGGDISVDDEANITGDVWVSGEFDGNNDSVIGEIHEHVADPEAEKPTDKIAPEEADRSYEFTYTGDLDGCDEHTNNNNELSLDDGDMCTLRSGVYHLEELHVADGATLELDTSDGPIVLHVEGQVTIEPDAEIHRPTDPYRSPSIQLVVEGNHDVSLGSEFAGFIDARESSVAFEEDVPLYGAVIAEQITLEQGAAIYFDERLLVEEGEELDFVRAAQFVYFDISVTEIEISE
ncbi:polymer-forming cytoskeletal protein [Natronosalvus vescus]|uniref:polymer-forming cytoskeletal protein n=1 Tax=Natronosalvus vescus TaxID=2953881 RepID=UPI002091AA33|nr:polymer-forming cytoskeletal protein [Natronosalvus vescus]